MQNHDFSCEAHVKSMLSHAEKVLLERLKHLPWRVLTCVRKLHIYCLHCHLNLPRATWSKPSQRPPATRPAANSLREHPFGAPERFEATAYGSRRVRPMATTATPKSWCPAMTGMCFDCMAMTSLRLKVLRLLPSKGKLLSLGGMHLFFLLPLLFRAASLLDVSAVPLIDV